MKKISLFVLFVFVSLVFFNCDSETQTSMKANETIVKEYKTLEKEFDDKLKAVKSRDAYKKWKDERKQQLEALLKKVEDAGVHDDNALLHGKVLFDLNKYDKALEKFEDLIKKKSPVSADAKFEKVRILQKKNETDEALALFQEIRNDVEKDKNYFEVIFEFAYTAKNLKVRVAYSNEFIKDADDSEKFAKYKGYMYENLALIEKDRGNLQKSIEILEKATGQMKSSEAKKSLESSLKQLKMLNTAAPEISAEQWVNSGAIKLAELKGKAVIIDFWAPWCPPCRKVIPTLVKSYNELKDKGLVVIGFTKIYGFYRDDIQDKGKVSFEEETALIKDYVKANEISYPIAIADKKTIFNTYNVTGIPTMYFIDKEGNIRDFEVGAGEESKLEAKIKELLE